MKHILVIGLCAILSSVAFAGQKGNGGDGLSSLFTEMGRRIHRESLMEPYKRDQVQLRDKISMELFYTATMETKVITTDQALRDNHGDLATAVYRNPDELTALWLSKGRSRAEVEAFLKEFPRGLIEFNRARFQEEIALGWGVALKTVFHEYGRAMGIDDSRYNYSADPEVSAFFQRLYDKSSPVTKHVLSAERPGASTLYTKLDFIDLEEARLKLVMRENRDDLAKILSTRGERIESQKKAFTAYGRAFADMIDSVGMIPMPSSSYAARIVRKQVDVVAEGMTLEQKMSETAVLDEQIRFLNSRLNQDGDFYLALEENRRRLVLEALR